MSTYVKLSFTEKFICLQSTITVGLTFINFDVEPIYMNINVNNLTLGKKVREAFDKSIYIHDTSECQKLEDLLLSPDHLAKVTAIKKQRAKDLKKSYGYKTLKDLDKDFQYLGISLLDDRYEFVSCITKKGGETGRTDIEPIVIDKNSTDEEIGNTVRIAMSLCKSIYK